MDLCALFGIINVHQERGSDDKIKWQFYRYLFVHELCAPSSKPRGDGRTSAALTFSFILLAFLCASFRFFQPHLCGVMFVIKLAALLFNFHLTRDTNQISSR